MWEGAKYRSLRDRFASIRCVPANDMAQPVVRPPIAPRGGPMLGHLSSDAAYLRAVLDMGAHQCLPPHHRAIHCLSSRNYGPRHAPSWDTQQAQAHTVVGLTLPWLYPHPPSHLPSFVCEPP
jgi:hypothetical protein